ncbi:MAG TPA: amino acid permease [Solirubrobacteraceae bacterium]|nr:amino acid permease [Solirubrobacteraceae bacterium]
MAERRLHGLQRVLGTYSLASSAYGNVGSSIYYALGLVTSFALGLTPVVFLISGAIFYLTAATYAEATAMYPEAGGSSSFARRAFNEFWSFFAAWGQMLNYTITIAISAFFVPHYLGGVLGIDAFRHGPADIFVGMAVVVVLAVINVRGAQESAFVNIGLAVADFGTQVLLVLVGLVLVFSPSTLVDNVHLGLAPTWKDFFLSIPVAMIAYTGIETISNMAEEAKDSAKTIPAAIKRVVVAVFAIYALLPAIALSALPVQQDANGQYYSLLGRPEDQGGFAGDPVLGVVKNMSLGPLQHVTEIYVGLLAATILFIATNAGVIGVSRLVYSMGLHRQVPDRLRRLHPRYGTPYLAIGIFAVVACIAMVPGKADFLGNMYAFGAMLSFTIAHLAVVRLRITEPDHERPYRGPGTIRIRGHDLPVFALLGAFGTGLAFLVVTALHADVAIAGIGWLALGIVAYVVYRRHLGLTLTETVKVAIPRPVTESEAEYDSILVAFEANRYVPQAIATAVKLAARRRRGVHVLVTLVVPASSPLDADLPEQSVLAQGIIEQARIQGGRRVTGHVERVRAGQSGRTIVVEAREMRAGAIVMPLPRRTGTTIFGKTLETVLTERPCRVIIESDPGSADKPVKAAPTVAGRPEPRR